MTGPDASSSSGSSEGRGPFLPWPLKAAGWQSALSTIWVRVAEDCPLCVPLGHVYRPQGCFAAEASVPVSTPVPSVCSHPCNCLPSFCSF